LRQGNSVQCFLRSQIRNRTHYLPYDRVRMPIRHLTILQGTLNLLELISLCSLVFPPTFFCSQDRIQTCNHVWYGFTYCQ
jgi:hypothetical protein